MSKPKQKTVVPSLRFPEFRDAGPWEVKRLGEIVRLRNGYAFRSSTYVEEGIYKIVTIANVQEGVLSLESTKRIASLPKDIQQHQMLKPGDILISMTGNVGRVCRVTTENLLLNQRVGKLEPKNINVEFLYQWLRRQAFRKIMELKAAGGAQGNLSSGDITGCTLLIPKSAAEQQKIADCLSSLDDLIRAEEAQLTALKDHKKGLIQRLFPAEGETTPRLRFPEFRDAGPWEVKRLGEVCKINPSCGGVPECFVYIDLESVEDGALIQRKTISKKRAPSRAQRVLQKGDVIYQMVRPYQKNNLLFDPDDDDKYVASTGYAQLRARGSSTFLFHLVHTHPFTSAVLAKSTGSNYPAINSSDLANVKIAIPDKSEQQKIADCLSSLDDLIRAKAARIEALKAHKKGLMQRLFPQDVA